MRGAFSLKNRRLFDRLRKNFYRYERNGSPHAGVHGGGRFRMVFERDRMIWFVKRRFGGHQRLSRCWFAESELSAAGGALVAAALGSGRGGIWPGQREDGAAERRPGIFAT